MPPAPEYFGYTVNTMNLSRCLSGANDFLPRYVQARMLGYGELYDINADSLNRSEFSGFTCSTPTTIAFHGRPC